MSKISSTDLIFYSLLIVGIYITILFGFRLYRNINHDYMIKNIADGNKKIMINDIKTWMPLDMIIRAFNLNQEDFYNYLSVPDKLRNHKANQFDLCENTKGCKHPSEITEKIKIYISSINAK